MSACPSCGHFLEPGTAECPACGVLPAKFKGHHPRPDSAPVVPGVPSPPSPRAGSTFGSAQPSWAGRIVVGLLLLGAVGAGLWLLRPPRFPALTFEAAAGNLEETDPCEGKRRCVVVVVAPWCGACKLGLPMMRELSDRWSRSDLIGFKPIVGAAPKAQCEAMAPSLGRRVYLDPANRLLQAFGETTVPHWFVVDPRGRVSHHSAGLIPDATAQIERLGLAKLDAAERRR